MIESKRARAIPMAFGFFLLNACAPTPMPAHVTVAPSSIPLPDGTDPNGIFWNEATRTLIVADEAGSRLLAWTDHDGWSALPPLPPSSLAHPGLGQPLQLADGTLFVTRFGGGTDGDVAVVHPDGTSSVVPNLDKTRRRIGLTEGPDGHLYVSYFVKTDAGVAGGVSRLDPEKGETEIVSGLQKAVGVLDVGSRLYVSEQSPGRLLQVELSTSTTPVQPTLLVALPHSDLLSAGARGMILTGGKDGIVRGVDTDGYVRKVAQGFTDVRGIAYDAAWGRIFFVDHQPPGNGKKSALLIRSAY